LQLPPLADHYIDKQALVPRRRNYGKHVSQRRILSSAHHVREDLSNPTAVRNYNNAESAS
ncbi:MAG: hypothetical protein J5773_06385, partial [Verrucomicrobia bacterium]|nr:hypothetical protein [Verrucomicrobiota bacterium]